MVKVSVQFNHQRYKSFYFQVLEAFVYFDIFFNYSGNHILPLVFFSNNHWCLANITAHARIYFKRYTDC